MRPLLVALPVVLALLSGAALPVDALVGTITEFSESWCGTSGDVYANPFAHPWALEARLTASERLAGAPPLCVKVGVDGPDLPEPSFPPELPPL